MIFLLLIIEIEVIKSVIKNSVREFSYHFIGYRNSKIVIIPGKTYWSKLFPENDFSLLALALSAYPKLLVTILKEAISSVPANTLYPEPLPSVASKRG